MISLKVFVAHNRGREHEARGPDGLRRSASLFPLRARHKAAMVLLVLLALAIAMALSLAFTVVGLVVAVPVLIVVGVGRLLRGRKGRCGGEAIELRAGTASTPRKRD